MGVAGDDDLFEPRAPAVAEQPSPEPRPVAQSDARRAGRVVAGLLLSTGTPPADEVARANQGLRRLGRPPLAEGDFVVETPEQLAPLIPVELRPALLALLAHLAGDEPIRRRLALAYAGLWQLTLEPAPSVGESNGRPVLRWLIGKLPRHHAGAPEEDAMSQGPYRGDAPPQPQAAPVERAPLRYRVERIRDEFLQVCDAVERVIIGKRDVIERVLCAMAARGHVLLVDVPGVGKTQLCKAISAAIETRFGRVQFTPDLLPMDITGA